MRSLTPWFILTVGGIFVLFMVLSDSGVSKMMNSGEKNIGSINGEEITYQQFSKIVDSYRDNTIRQQGKEVDETEMEQLRDQAWEGLISQTLMQQKIKEYNIIVTDDEIKSVITGEDPPAYLKQNFTDSTGNFNREAYEAAILDPRNKNIMIQVEEQIREQLLQQKLSYYVNAGIVVSDSDLKKSYLEQNLKMTAEYIMVSFAAVPDSMAKVTDADLKDYYNEHLDEFKVEPQRKLKYVLFKRAPSKDDTVGVLNNLNAIVDKIKRDTSDFKTYAEIYSETPYSKDTVNFAKLPQQVGPVLAKSNPGDIVGPALTNEGCFVYHLVQKVTGKETFVNASHILIKSGTDDAAAKKEADDIYKVLISGGDFANVAINRSQDPGSGKNGGELGWFGKGQMVPEFENACFNAPVGQIQKPIKTSYGYHIIKVTEKSSESFVVESIFNKIQPSGSTLDNLYNSANDFSYLAINKEGFDAEAKRAKYQVLESQPFKEDATTIPGLGSNKAILNFAFENSVGEVSEVFRIPAGYIVATLAEVIEAGVKPFEEVKDGIRPAVVKEKKLEKSIQIVNDLNKRINGDFSKAKYFFRDAVVDTAKEFTIIGNVPGIGNDPAFSQFCSTAEVGKISKPFKGQRGSYIVKLVNKTQFDNNAFELQKNSLRDRLLQQKRQQLFTQWLQKVKEESDIVDNRYLFFR
ncbi:MAG: peptidylprolyl isomerase [bacterium]